MKKIPHSRSIPQRVQYGSLEKGVLPPEFETVTDHLTLCLVPSTFWVPVFICCLPSFEILLYLLKDFLLHLATECCWLWCHSMMFLNFEFHVNYINAIQHTTDNSKPEVQQKLLNFVFLFVFFSSLLCSFIASTPNVGTNSLKFWILSAVAHRVHAWGWIHSNTKKKKSVTSDSRHHITRFKNIRTEKKKRFIATGSKYYSLILSDVIGSSVSEGK